MPVGTIVSAEDSDGGEFVGIVVQDGPYKGTTAWTNTGWLQETK
ncbi:hypothetical protein [Bradyrhizobium sp. 169]|nr:hypothetical protein [Bradyrhizobium sp. 169]